MFNEVKKVKVLDFADALGLEIVYGDEGAEMELSTINVNRPGLQFAGFFDYFAANRIQLVGNAEQHYLNSMSAQSRAPLLEKFFGVKLPCLIMSRNHDPHEDLLAAAKRHGCPVFKSPKVTTALMNEIVMYLNRELAPTVTKHAGLIDVYGVGVLIIGKSGIGKSETALELIKHGHRMIADDSVIIKQINGSLVGSCPELIRYFMEVRGIGIIDVRAMYGVGAVRDEKRIDMVVELEKWDEEKNYDRLGDKRETCEILEVTVPKVTIPVKPGRNLSIIIEVAARNARLKATGYDAALELIKRSTM